MRASSASSIQGSNLKQSGIMQFLENGRITPPTNNGDFTNSLERLENKKCFISEDFEGVSLLRTTCLECEQVTERKETFCDICVPIEVDRSNEKGTMMFLNSFNLILESDIYDRFRKLRFNLRSRTLNLNVFFIT